MRYNIPKSFWDDWKSKQEIIDRAFWGDYLYDRYMIQMNQE